jgi:RNA polymerase sigma factor (sigma-70 family)
MTSERDLDSKKIAMAKQTRTKSLLQAVQVGDRRAYTKLYEQTFSQVYAVARSLLPSSDDAKEVVCDVYLYVWQHADRYDESRGSIKTWLTIIARNRAIDLRRHQFAECLDAAEQKQVSECLYGETCDPHAIVAQLQTQQVLRRAMKSLTPLRRQLIGLAFFGELSHQEISEAMQRTLGTVKSHGRRALNTQNTIIQATGLE